MIATASDSSGTLPLFSTTLIVVQPTSLCNLNCRYCYVPNRLDPQRMSRATLKALAQRVFTSPWVESRVEFLWHAGEPLTVGVEYLTEALEIIQGANRHQIKVQHTLQTNATLVTEQWCELFKQHDFHVGVSIDGPAFLHDATRRNWSGAPSHAATLRGFHLLRNFGIRCGALCVLTRHSLKYPLEILDFFRSEGFHSVGFNIEETEGINSFTSFHSQEIELLQDEYKSFVSKLFEAHATCRGSIRIREFSDVVASIRAKRQNHSFRECPVEAREFAALTIQKNGDVSTFSPEFASLPSKYGRFVIGNVHEQSFVEMWQSSSYRRIAADVQRSRDLCEANCQYFDLCGGAYFSNKVAEHGTLLSTETRSCRLHKKALCDVVLQKLTLPSRRSDDRLYHETEVGPPTEARP